MLRVFLTTTLLLPCLLVLLPNAATSYVTPRQCTPKNAMANRMPSPSAIFSILDDITKSIREERRGSSGEEEDANEFEFSRLNPLTFSANNRISLRKMTMTELLNELLNISGDEGSRLAQMRSILAQYEDFLLEPLEDDAAVLDPDSIYTPGMDRTERYRAYRKSMEERVGKAQKEQVKQVLTVMKDYVLGHE